MPVYESASDVDLENAAREVKNVEKLKDKHADSGPISGPTGDWM